MFTFRTRLRYTLFIAVVYDTICTGENEIQKEKRRFRPPRKYRNAAHNAYMNLQKLTQKSLEAVQQARDLALENGNQQLQ